MHVPELLLVLATSVSPCAGAHLPAPLTHLLFLSCASLVPLLLFSALLCSSPALLLVCERDLRLYTQQINITMKATSPHSQEGVTLTVA